MFGFTVSVGTKKTSLACLYQEQLEKGAKKIPAVVGLKSCFYNSIET